MEEKNTYTLTVSKNDDSTVEIRGEIPVDEFESYRKKALKNLSAEVSIPGFRKGHVPEKVLIEKIGEPTVLHEMAEMALSSAYPKILLQEKIDAISAPQIQITKIASKNPLGFTIKTAVMPEVTLADYKKIAQAKVKGAEEPEEVKEKDINEALLKIRKSLAAQSKTPEELAEIKDEALPELTDEDVKKFGEYENVEDFKKKLSQSLEEEKKRAHKEKVRLGIIEEIINESKINLPEILVEEELSRMVTQFKGDIEKMGMKPEEYLANIKKTEDDMRKEWRADAEKRVKSELILSEIAKKESIHATDEEVEKETEHIVSHYPTADKERIRAYVAHTLANTKVFEFLENQK